MLIRKVRGSLGFKTHVMLVNCESKTEPWK